MNDESNEQVASTEFAGGAMRPVYQTPEGRQYVIDDNGQRVYGVWYWPREDHDTPAVVDDRDF
jgi:PBCV-specific basic adaptor domain